MAELSTPLTDEHRSLGATLTPFAGYLMPLRYSGDLAEHRAVREAGGLFDLSHMGEIEVSGPQAGPALEYALVGKLADLAVGKAKYTMMCTEDGGIVDDLIVYRLDDDRFMVVANAANTDVVATELTARCAGFEAEVVDETAGWALIALQGPTAAEVLGSLTDADLAALKYYTILPATVAGRPARLARTGYTGEDGFEVFCAPDDAVALWRELLAAGEPSGVIPCGLAARDSLRLEAGMPLYGHELTDRTTPYEAGLGRVVALTKPDFVGRAALAARAEQTGGRRLAGLTISGRRAARAGYPVLDAAGEEVGIVTSGLPSPTLGHPIALAYLPEELIEPGTTMSVSLRGTPVPAEVVALPFYRRARS